jgi:hypothetical protein
MKVQRSEEELFTLWAMLDIEFMQLPPASLAKVGDQLLEWLLWRERLRNGLEATIEDRWTSDRRTLEKLATWDTAAPELVVLEKVFRKMALGSGQDAILLLKRSIEKRHAQLRTRQQHIAKKPRGTKHPLTAMVEVIVSSKPTITEQKLFHELRKSCDVDAAPCTYSPSSEKFKPIDKKFADVPKKNLRQYLYRAKKLITVAG